MAKKAMVEKQKRTPKYSTRAYTRCKICGRPHALPIDIRIVEYVLENLLTKVKSLALRKQVGRNNLKKVIKEVF